MMDVANDFFEIMDLEGLTIEGKIQKLSFFYENLPEPRTEVNNSYLFVSAIGDFAEKETMDLVQDLFTENDINITLIYEQLKLTTNLASSILMPSFLLRQKLACYTCLRRNKLLNASEIKFLGN